MKPRIAIALGDPAGIGAELVARLLAMPESAEGASCVVIGDEWLLRRGLETAGVDVAYRTTTDLEPASVAGDGPLLLELPTVAPEEITPGEASAAGGRSALTVLARAAQLALDEVVDAILFAPLNKTSLHLAGFGYEDELRWFAHELGHDGYVGELNLLEELWTSRVTSHVPLASVAGMIDEGGIVDAIHLVDRELRRAGVERPRIGVAALNPHGGDGGNFGREEIDLIGPAVRRVAAEGVGVHGPYPADTVFVRARGGAFDAVVTMYHDQGQIAMKLMGFERGVTVLGGLPVPISTPAHGTAFDLVGQGRANPEAMRQAFRIASRMGGTRRAERTAAPTIGLVGG